VTPPPAEDLSLPVERLCSRVNEAAVACATHWGLCYTLGFSSDSSRPVRLWETRGENQSPWVEMGRIARARRITLELSIARSGGHLGFLRGFTLKVVRHSEIISFPSPTRDIPNRLPCVVYLWKTNPVWPSRVFTRVSLPGASGESPLTRHRNLGAAKF
jgi:hypothetical protein